jgi:uncharacterized protein YcsI (UPF0317 family)
MRHNPFAPIVPCHRVVASDLKLGGFSGNADPASPELTRKVGLLESEGVEILLPMRKVSKACVYDFSRQDVAAAKLAYQEHALMLGKPGPAKAKAAARKKPAASAASSSSSKRDREGAGSGRTSKVSKEAARGAAASPSRISSSPSSLRAACRSGSFTAPTAGLCGGFAQANLVILPGCHAADFAEFCRLNAKPCPLLEVTSPGSASVTDMAAACDVRSDLPRYRVWRHGKLAEADVTDATPFWAEMQASAAASAVAVAAGDGNREDDAAGGGTGTSEGPVAFLLGCSFSFEEALLAAGLPVRHIEQGVNVPMYVTSIQTRRVGAFAGPMVVSMRPMTPEQAALAQTITARFSRVHGAPIHVGSPGTIGIKDLKRPDFGDAVEVRAGEVPVFWACGVTPQMALQHARLPLAISHSPGHMLVLDKLNTDLADPVET